MRLHYPLEFSNCKDMNIEEDEKEKVSCKIRTKLLELQTLLFEKKHKEALNVDLLTNSNIISNCLSIFTSSIYIERVPLSFLINIELLLTSYIERLKYFKKDILGGPQSSMDLNILLNDLKTTLQNILNQTSFENNKLYNTTEFYSQQLDNLNKSKDDLERKLENLKKEKDAISRENTKQASNLKEGFKRIKDTEQALKETADRLSKTHLELEEIKRNQDAQTNWDNKITEIFEKLSDLLKPIDREIFRLRWMFGIYAVLSISILIFLGFLEYILAHKLSIEVNTPNLIKYLPYYVPIPISGALLWAFIVQMNRSQRQLLMLAEQKHHIKYIEGLMLSLNKLSPNIDDAVKRINDALDRLIENYLNNSTFNFTEEKLIKEDCKDNISINNVVKILRGIKTFN